MSRPKKKPPVSALREELPTRAREEETVPYPTKFTPQVRATILTWIRNGCFRYQACAAAGITRKTLHSWETKAKDEPEGEYAEFLDQMQLAQDLASGRLAAIHNALATGTDLPPKEGERNPVILEKVDLRALQFQMERGGDRAWAQRLEHTGKDGAPLEAGTARVVVMPAKEAEPD